VLEYALHKDSNTLRHIDSAENGLKCNCVCPGCGDRLVAKNNGTKGIRHHFSHDSKDENSNCLMTQLHLVAQHFFLESTPLLLPSVSFQYKEKILTHKEVSTSIHRGALEARIDQYVADVLLDTELGNIVIEVFVTHENEAEKTAYYQQNQIPSIEFDLSTYLNRNIDEALSDLKANQVPYKWLYEWCREPLIDKHEQFLAHEAERIKKKRLRSAKDSARKFTKGNYILLPSLTQEFECQIDGYTYREEITIYSRSEQYLDSVSQVKLTEEYLLLKGVLGDSYIWLALLLKDCLPKDVVELDGSVVIRTPSTSANNRATWKWLKYPKLMPKIERTQQVFLKESDSKAKKARTTKDAVRQAKANSEIYLLSKDNLFKRDYSIWSKWMTLNRLFQPSSTRKHPKLPHALNYIRSYPSLWAFDTWHILTLSLLAEIVDRKPKDTKIFYDHLFKELAERTGLHEEFSDIEQRIAPHAVNDDKKSIVLRSEIIEEALRPYANSTAIYRLEGGCRRLGSLMEVIDLDSTN
jgi:hypothetical protein